MRSLIFQHAFSPVVFMISVAGVVVPVPAQRDTIRTQVDLVLVPTSVRGPDGKIVNGLKKDDFSIFEDGKLQQIQQFSTDPVPLSVVVIVDTGIGGSALRRFSSSISALSSVFVTDFDEAAVYRFNKTIVKVSDFTKDQKSFEKSMESIRSIAKDKGDRSDQPFVIAPGRGPRWLRWLLDGGLFGGGSTPRPLHETLWKAAEDLEKRPEENRRIIVVMSDGQIPSEVGLFPWSRPNEYGIAQARDRAVKEKIQVYGVTVGLGVLGGGASILHTYATATGGDVYSGRDHRAMETAFSAIGEEARYQYVLSCVSNNELVGQIPVARKIEVKVDRDGMKVNHRRTYLQFPKND